MANVRRFLARKWPIGKRNGNWFIRIPLWVQATILIFLAGFLSLLVLTVVAGIKTWEYSEGLMKDRLANFAAMTALQIEEDFSETQNRLAAASSSQSLVSVLNAINQRNAGPKTWEKMEEQFDIQFQGFPSLDAFVLYDKHMRIVYTYRRRRSSDLTVAGQQSLLAPEYLLPLSNISQRENMLSNINNYTGGVISNSVLPRWTEFASQPVNVTFSVSRGVPHDYEDVYTAPFNDGAPKYARKNTTDWAGYCTFLVTTPFPYMANVSSSSLFDSYQVLTAQMSQVRSSDFTLLVPFTDKNDLLNSRLTWPIQDFPAVRSATELVKEIELQQQPQPRQNSSVPDNSTSFVSPEDGPTDDPRDDNNSPAMVDNSLYRRNHGSALRYDKINLQSQDFTVRTTNGNVSTVGKQGRAVMRTRTPWESKSSVGYSYANVLNQKWLIFVQISQSEAFNPAVNLRNVVIGVGVGILGAVVLIMAPLSRWQTRGFYVIYQNMRLRPMFVSYGEEDTEDAKDGSGDKKAPKYEKTDLALNRGYNSSKSTESAPSSQESSEAFVDLEAHSIEEVPPESNVTSANARGRVPTRLPSLNRIYTDELDDLIFEYNNMVDRLNNQYLHLEDQVRLRTQEAQRARELTEEANNAKSEFIAIISHELRTPLNGIMGLTSVSVEEQDALKIKNSLALIIESGRVLMDLLNELLELSKSLVGVEPSVRLFTPSNLLEILPNMFQSRATDLSVTFALAAVPSDLRNVTLRGDADHVVQICLNFMSNAMKFSESNGTVSVILHLRPFNDPLISTDTYSGSLNKANSVLEILVTDSGVGMSPSQLGKIFDLFVQGNDPLRKNHRGAGLGMALSKQLAEGIGGYVAVFSAEGVGSTVVLRVPVECVGRSPAEVNALDGPPIEFKVKDVYTTLSCETGVVKMVKQIQWQRGSYDGRRSSIPTSSLPASAATVPYPPSPSARRSRHAHQSSSGSKMLLTRAHPVTKLLKSHHQQPSHSTAFTSLHSGSSTSDGQNDLISPMNVISNQHKNDSSSSLLLVMPPIMDDQSSSRQSRISWYSAELSLTPSPHDREPSPSRQSMSHSSTPVTSAAPVSSGGTHCSQLSYADSRASTISPVNNTIGSPVMFVTNENASPTFPEIDTSAKILIAEDNALNSQIMVKMLKQLGLSAVSTASNGQDAIKLVEESIVDGYHFGVIFMDISMPFINGIDATQFIRTTLGYPYPIVALTGFSDAQSRSAILAVSIQEVLAKPVMKADILRVLKKYIGVAPH